MNTVSAPTLPTKPLPPDPDDMNDARAVRAHQTLEYDMKLTRTDFEDAMSDLLNNLRHFCDRHDMDFDAELQRANGHYEEETSG